MTASEIIKHLNDLIKEFGDLPVTSGKTHDDVNHIYFAEDEAFQDDDPMRTYFHMDTTT